MNEYFHLSFDHKLFWHPNTSGYVENINKSLTLGEKHKVV